MPPPEYEAWGLVGMDCPHRERPMTAPECWWMYQVRRSMGQRSVVAEWYQEVVREFEMLLNRYVLAPLSAVKDVYVQCHADPPGLWRMLKMMHEGLSLPAEDDRMRPRLAAEDDRMRPLLDMLVYLDNLRRIPKAIQDMESDKARYAVQSRL